MRITLALVCIALLSACAPDREREEASTTGVTDVTLADFAGTWHTTNELTGVKDPVESQLIGSADGSSWTLKFPDRDPVPMHMSVVDDSLIGVSDRYESVLRPGVMVTVRSASVRQGDAMTGNVRVVYHTQDGDEVVKGTMRSSLAN